MKKLSIFILALSVGLSSCNLLDVTPENAVTFKSYFKTEQDFATATVQMHSFMKHFRGLNPHIDMGMCADIILNWDKNSVRNLTPKSILGPSSSWKEHYDLIYMANVILDNAYRANEGSEEWIDFYLGQAHFCLGMAYLGLSQTWGEAIITENSENLKPYAKSSKMDVINKAITHAKEAYGLLPVYENILTGSSSQFTKQYGSKGSVAALLAHAYAWKGSLIDLYEIQGENSRKAYEDSVYWATELIEKRAGTTYELETNVETLCIAGLKGLGASKESIFEFETDYLDEYYTNYCPINKVTNWPVNKTVSKDEHPYNNDKLAYGVTPDFVEAMYEVGVDKRLVAFFTDGDSDLTEWTTPVPDPWADYNFAFPRKLREFIVEQFEYYSEARGCRSNWVYWRLADIYLLRAECNAKLGNNSPAITDLNEIRTRAGATAYPAPGETDLKYAIFKEREKELIFEGHRYYDVVRNGYFRTELSDGFARLTDLDVRNGALFLPISPAAFTLNDILHQNDYWAEFDN